jgi:hypothetical protein
MSFETCVSAICYTIIQNRVTLSTNQFPHNGAVNFAIAQHQQMPDYLRLPIWLLTLGFNGAGLITGGKFYFALSDRLRWQQIQAWRNSFFSPCRDLIRFYESLVIFYCYDANSFSDDTDLRLSETD